MNKDEWFSDEVCREIGCYVYRLIDPRNGETFYVGKGRNNRVFAHINALPETLDGGAELDSEAEDEVSAKFSRIHEIRRAGLEVLHIIHRHNISDDAIFAVEASLIDAYPGLSNIASGHGSSEYGPMHAQEIIAKYDLPTINWEPEHKLLLINVNRFDKSSDEDLYLQTRFAWRLNKARAEKADYVLAVVRGVVKGAFVATRWDVAIKENFPEISYDEPLRHAFEGQKAPDDICEMYVGKQGKRIAIKDLRHVQNPVRYWKV